MKTRIVLDFNSPKVRKNLIFIIIAVVVLIVATAFYLITIEKEAEAAELENQLTSSDEEETEEDAAFGSIYVDISGAVNQPSVLVLPEGSRVFEAIEAAGGLAPDANIASINRAEILEDGAYLYIPTNKEIEQEDKVPVYGNAGSSAGSSGVAGSTSGTSQGKININTADSDTLQQLNGVGPATAQKIIDYRTNSGKFKKIEDLKNVSGIGEKTFEKLAPYVKV